MHPDGVLTEAVRRNPCGAGWGARAGCSPREAHRGRVAHPRDTAGIAVVGALPQRTPHQRPTHPSTPPRPRVVLLDEVEKAHPDVLEMFFQVFDKGVMDDAEGREIDFRNTVIILTSNVGSQQIMQACLNKAPEELPDADTLAEALRPVLFKSFKPAFLGRLKVVPFYPISDEVLVQIIRLKLDRIGARVAANHKASFEADDKLVEAVLARCTEVDSGARNVDHILGGTLLPEIAETVLAQMAEGKPIARIKVSAAKNGDFKYTVH